MTDRSSETRSAALAGSFFAGEERLEHFALLGRAIRKGTPAALGVSDGERVRQTLREGNADLARQYLGIVRGNSEGMVVIYAELVLAFAKVLHERVPAVDARAVVRQAHRLLSAIAQEQADDRVEPGVAAILEIFHPDRTTPESVAEYRSALGCGAPTVMTELLASTARDFADVSAAIDRGAHGEAAAAFDRYFTRMRVIHDALVDLTALLLSSTRERFGQAVMDEVHYQAFTTCGFYEGLWAAVKPMSPEETAAFLADHLRAHFSGDDRQGAVEIVEEADRYRLILAPCGSGGAMRRRAQVGVPDPARPLPEATTRTWGRAGQVSGLCSHCAINEIESVRRVGYPIFVTEFDPDPRRPCGWTVYKRPDRVPEEVFVRIGAVRDPSRFPRTTP